MRKIDTNEYISTLRELTEEGREVGLTVSGSSMSPFLIHERDYICFKKPDRDLRRGDMVFYQRESGQFVMHRILKVKPEGYYIIGDAQTEIEGPVRREQFFAVVTRVKRKGKWIQKGNFWWEFFARVWRCAIPRRRPIVWLYAKVRRIC